MEHSSIYSDYSESKAPTTLPSSSIVLPESLISRQNVTQEEFRERLQEIEGTGVLYRGTDALIWGLYFICVYHRGEKLYSIMVDKFGLYWSDELDITKKSQYRPAMDNLASIYKNSNAHKAIAVTLLQRFPKLTQEHLDVIGYDSQIMEYDPVHVGDLANTCQVVSPNQLSMENFVQGLAHFSIYNTRKVSTMMIDVVYENSNEKLLEQNNKLVYYLGTQLEQLFNPVTEYSPEPTEYSYKPPDNQAANQFEDSDLVKNICKELLTFQANFTFNLVEFLQNFLINLRIKVINNEIEGLSTVKLNRLFPPTIDEVTRINCIFLDSLKLASDFGALEILKACSVTFPYFYKAYTRHEAATKNFHKDVRLFLAKFDHIIPLKDKYTAMNLETIITGPQEKLTKLKLFIERLWKSQEWNTKCLQEAERYYKNIIDVIDSFGNLKKPLGSYSTRVFTPSGKILTELAKGWPVELQYKWLKRRVVGVFDVEYVTNDHVGSSNVAQKERKLLVIFSDYLVFMNILGSASYYDDSATKKLLISDILMNSLINEVPIPSKIPKLEVDKYCYINNVLCSILDHGQTSRLRIDNIDTNSEKSFSVYCNFPVQSVTPSHVAELITKAKILEKDTSFHLFRSVDTQSDVTIYSIAHESESYKHEKTKSKVAIFLNIPASHQILHENSLMIAGFVNYEEDTERIGIRFLTSINSDEEKENCIQIQPQDLIANLISKIADEFPNYYASWKSPIVESLFDINLDIMKQIIRAPAMSSNIPMISHETDFKQMDVSVEAMHVDTNRSFKSITSFTSQVSDLKLQQDHCSNAKTASTTMANCNDKSGQRRTPLQTKSPIETSTITNKLAEPRAASFNECLSKNTRNRKRGFFFTLKKIFAIKNKAPGTVFIAKIIESDRITDSPPDKSPLHFRSKKPPITKDKHLQNFSSQQKNAAKVLANNSDVQESKKSYESVLHNEVTFDKGKNNKTITESQCGENLVPEVDKNTHEGIEKGGKPDDMSNLDSDEIGLVMADYSKSCLSRIDVKQGLDIFDDDLFGDFADTKAPVSKPVNKDIGFLGTFKSESSKAPSMNDKISDQDRSLRMARENNTSLNGSSPLEENAPKIVKPLLSTKADSIDTTPIAASPVKMFPVFPKTERKQDDMPRSASYWELYKTMRLVQDTNDASYNWKRLPSQNNLNADSQFNKTFGGDEAKAKTQRFDTIKEEVEQKDDIGTPKLKPPIIIDHGTKKALLKESRSHINNIVYDTDFGKRKPFFKVVSVSPKKTLTSTDMQNGGYSVFDREVVSGPSYQTLHETPKSRKFWKMKLQSQEGSLFESGEVLETKEPEDAQSNPAVHNSDESRLSLDYTDNISTGSMPKNDFVEDKGTYELLDDLEFSAFDMAFSNSPGGSDRVRGTHYSSNTKTGSYDNNINDEPLFYRLTLDGLNFKEPNYMENQNDEEPIWISPSKLDFCDFTNDYQRARVGNCNSKISKGGSIHNDKHDGGFLSSSFGYLSSIVALDV